MAGLTRRPAPSGPEARGEAAGKTGRPATETPADPRAVRVALGATSRLPGDGAVVVAPPPEPLAPLPVTWAGRGVLGGAGIAGDGQEATPVGPAREYMVDGRPTLLALERLGAGRARLVRPEAGTPAVRVVFVDEPVTGADGIARREVVADGWRFEVELEPERRAALRERARRGREATSHGGPTEVHAIIPGRVAAVSVVPGDEVTAGQQILVVEAMKMQNELRSPKDGVVKRVGVAVGRTIEVGDLLVVIE